MPAVPIAIGQTVDLTSCDREPIHLVGAIQPVGFLVVIAADWIVTRVSANVPDYLGRSVDELLGASLRDVITVDALHAIRVHLAVLSGETVYERASGVRLQDGGPLFDLAMHLVGTDVVLECEPSEAPGRLTASSTIQTMVGRLQQEKDLGRFMGEATRQVRGLTGFDRVMLYRFHPDGSGEVIAESARAGLDAFLGLRYPAGDIPHQARALLKRNPLRMVPDIEAPPVPVLPVLDAAGEPLDLSMSVLRASSPIHVEYLRNMGVAASMTISILKGGRLWGLITCHHMAPHHVGFERRTAAELFGQMFSLLLQARVRDEEAAYEARCRRLHFEAMTSIAAEAAPLHMLGELAKRMADLVPSDGIGIWVDGHATLTGSTPTEEEFIGLMRFVDRKPPSQVYLTNEIGADYPPARDYADRAAGLLAIPISQSPRDCLVFFRREVAHSVTWAGNPNKPVEVGPNGSRLTPRKSFEAWREQVRGQSTPWTEGELRAAEAVRITVLEIILQLAAPREQERRTAVERQVLLVAELNHRVRNILGLIRGLITQSKGGAKDVDHFADVLGGRVQAMARAHDQITADSWGPAPLAGLIATEAAAYLGPRANRVRASGPAVLLTPTAFSTLALLIHELMTNAAKHGALCDHHGGVTIEWHIETRGALVIDWQEAGGPPVQAPIRRGFGSIIIERTVPYELKGEATIDYRLAGVHARFVVPAVHLAFGLAVPRFMDAAMGGIASKLSGDVLLVEDSMIIALDAEEMLLRLGARRVDTANSIDEAMRLLDLATPGFAVLDVNLGEETSFPIADRLRALGVPHVFATGYGDEAAFPSAHAGTPIVKKPYTTEAIGRAVSSH